MEALLAPIDAVRVRALHALGPVARPFVVDRDLRVAAGAAIGTATALACALFAPMWTIALAPLVLGVPHIVADLRYLVLRPALHRDGRLVAFAGVPLALAACGGGLRAALVATMAALVVARGDAKPFVRAAAIAALVPFAWAATRAPAVADAVFAQLHNVLAVVLWWAWRPQGDRGRRSVWRTVGLACIVAAAFGIVSGALDGAVAHGLGWRSHARGLGVSSIAEALAPGLKTTWALRLVLLYAFGQSVHYAVWLRLVPDEDRARATPRTFAATLRALRADVGTWLLAAAALVALLLLGWALFDVRAARAAYVRFSAFHGYLELVAMAVGVARGRLRLTA